MIERAPGMIKDLIRAALATGAREDELLRAQRPDIDDTRRQMTLVGKRNKRRTIDLEPFGGYDLIRSLPSHINSQLVFWHSDGESYKNFASQFAAIVGRTAAWAKAEGIDFRPFRFHDLRHWHAVHWAKVEQQRLGHSSIKVTEGYLRCGYLTFEELEVAKAGAPAQPGTNPVTTSSPRHAVNAK